MANSGSGKTPPNAANPFVEAALGKATTLPLARQTSRADGRGKLRKLVGFLAAAPTTNDELRRLFADHALDRGIDIPVSAIRYWVRLEADRHDGLERDTVWIEHDADLLYFSRTPPERDDPPGGNGFDDGPPFG